MERHDAIVVGAGPGGAQAAYHLSRAGCRVLIIERQKLPRYKACGGGIPAGVFATLPAACSQAIERRVTRARFQFGEGWVEHPLPGQPVAMVMRERFDHLLLAESQATIHDGEGVARVDDGPAGVVVHTTRGERYTADYVIGADGAFSIVARSAGLRRGHAAGPALEAELSVGSALLEEYAETALFLLDALRDGYAWVFPKRGHLSVGIGAFRGSGSELRRRLQEIVRQLGLPAGGLQPRGHALPAYARREPLQRGRILLVGDAAGLVDPLSGEGIRHALHSGRLAAETIRAGTVAGYSQRVYEEIGRDLGAGRWLARLFYTFPRLCFQLGARDRTVINGLARLLSGEATYRELLAQMPPHYLGRLFGLRPHRPM